MNSAERRQSSRLSVPGNGTILNSVDRKRDADEFDRDGETFPPAGERQLASQTPLHRLFGHPRRDPSRKPHLVPAEPFLGGCVQTSEFDGTWARRVSRMSFDTRPMNASIKNHQAKCRLK